MVDVNVGLIMEVRPLMHEVLLVNQLHQGQVASPLALQLYLHPAQAAQP